MYRLCRPTHTSVLIFLGPLDFLTLANLLSTSGSAIDELPSTPGSTPRTNIRKSPDAVALCCPAKASSASSIRQTNSSRQLTGRMLCCTGTGNHRVGESRMAGATAEAAEGRNAAEGTARRAGGREFAGRAGAAKARGSIKLTVVGSSTPAERRMAGPIDRPARHSNRPAPPSNNRWRDGNKVSGKVRSAGTRPSRSARSAAAWAQIVQS